MNTQDRSTASLLSSRADRSTTPAGQRFALRPLALALAAASLLSVPGLAVSPARAQASAALPSGLNVMSGQASAVINGQQMTVTNSANSILNWQSFSIGSGNGVYFAQPDSASKVLNRVVGNDPSAILGNLGSNGHVWLLNPNGVLFGQGARVDVGGLVTSTLRLNDIDWLSGRYTFAAANSDPAAAIVNQGELRSSMGGRIALLGGSVRNEGLIEAPGGQIMLAAGRSIDLVDTGTPNLRLRVTAPDGEAMNLGTLAATGGRIDVHAAMVNQQGIVRADGLATDAAGDIVLRATRRLDLRDGSITSASGAIGGKVTLDAGAGTAMLEGDVLATGTSGPGGQIKALGSQVGMIGAARLDVSGRSGGEVLVGGGERGQDASVPNSRAVFMADGASITADAQGEGDGGRIILWSDDATRAYGSFSARGGAAGGNGGFIETSGGWIDVQPARLDATAAAGLAGTWLLDPWNILISNSVTGNSNVTATPTFTATGTPAQISPTAINSALNNGNNVVISTGSTGGESGDITVQSATISAAPNVPVSLTLQAARNIDIRSSTITGTGAGLSVNLNAAGSGAGSVYIGSSISTGGGSISASGIGRGSDSYLEGFGVYVSSSLNAGSGNISLIGRNIDLTGLSSARSGIALSSATLTGRDITLTGSHSASNLANTTGVDIYNSTLTASHALSLRGTSSSVGVSVDQSTLAVTPAALDPGASLFIDGTSTWTNFSATSFVNNGVYLSGGGYGGTLQTRNGATIDITGHHQGGTQPSLNIANGLVVDAINGGGNARFTANSPLAISGVMNFDGTALFQGDQVTILGGTMIRSNAAGDAIVIAGKSGPNTLTFANNAGAGALTTPNGRWLIYGQNTMNLMPGGLAYAFKQYNARYGEANPATPTTGNGLLYAEAPVVSVTANPFSKTYDGTTSAGPFTGVGTSGQRDGDIGTTGSATGNFADRNAGLNKAITLTPTSITFTDTSGRPVLGYGLSSNISGDILRRNVSLTGVSAGNKVYDGNTTAVVTGGSLNNLVGSETLGTSLTGNFDTKDVGNGKIVTVNASLSNGTNGGLASNYNLTPTGNTTADITRRQLTGSFTAANKVYDGTTAASVAVVGLGNLVAGETLGTSATGNFNTKDVGTAKPVTVNVVLANGSGGGLASNYLAPVAAGATTADITRKTVTASNISAANKVYDGNTSATVTVGGLSGLVGSETLGTTASGSFDTKDAGTGKTVTVGTTLSDGSNGGLASNYTLAPTGNTTADITRRQLTGSFTAANKVYDGTTAASVAVVGLGNLVAGETLGTSATGNFNTKDVGTAKPVTVNVVLANGSGGGLASNYLAPVAAGATTADITRKTVTASNISAANKVYDGNTSATVTVGGLSGLVGSETLGTTASGSFDTKDAGTGKTVTVGTTLSDGSNGGLASNYTLAPTGNTTADITRRQLTGSFTAANKVYDGTTAASVAVVGLGNLVAGETLGTSATGNFNTKDVGTAKPVTVNVVLANGSGGGLASNYLAPVAAGATTADITRKTVTASNISAANKVYDGNTSATVTVGGLSGLVGSETLGTTASGSFDTKDAGTGKTVTVGTTLSDGSNGGLASNYTLAPTGNTTADITRRQLTGSFTAANKVYDGTTAASVAVVGLGNLVAGETLGTSATGNFNTKDVGTAKPVTVNVVLANGSGGGLASNYLAPVAAGATTADITRKTVTASNISAANKVYDGNTSATVTVGGLSGLVGTETLGTTASGTFDTKDAGTNKTVTVGTALSNGTNGGLASNYTLAPTGATTADITRRQLTGSFTAADKIYDGSTVASVTLAGLGNLVGAETLNVTPTGTFNSKDVGNAKPVTVSSALANGTNGGLASNYLAPSTTPAPTAAITPATLTYTANLASKLVGAPVPPLAGNVGGFVAGETQSSATTGTLAFITPATANSPAGQFAINGSGLSAGNYRFVQAPANATALTVRGLAAINADEGRKVALNQSLALASLPPVWSGPAEGRVFDVVQALSGNYLAQGSLFRAIPVDDMSQEALTTLLTARDKYKKALFADSIRQLEQNPGLADVPPCKSAQEVDNGSCLITADLKQQLKGGVSEATLVAPGPTAAAPAPATAPTPAPAPGVPPTDVAIAVPPAPPREGVGGTIVEPTPIFARSRVRTAALPQIERKIAVVIGINRYSDRRMPQLDNAVGDAKAIGRILEQQLGYETVVLENATKAAVVRTLNRLAIELEPRDSVVVYYAGHGELVTSTGIGYWQLSDSSPTQPETWLSNADISRTIAKISADQVALISDSCYSGSLVDERIRATAGTVDPQLVLAKKTVVVMSSGGNEPVADEGKNGHSPFAYNLMRNLEQVANWQVGGNLFERVRFAVARQLPQRPLYGSAAAAGHQPGGDYLFEQRQLDQ